MNFLFSEEERGGAGEGGREGEKGGGGRGGGSTIQPCDEVERAQDT